MRHYLSLFTLLVISNLSIAQKTTDWQLWNNVEVGSDISNQFYLSLDARYRTALGSDLDNWNKSGLLVRSKWTFNKTWSFYFDIINYYTSQNNEENSYEFSQRLGVAFFIFKNGNSVFRKGEPALIQISPRLELSNFSRIEHRMFRYMESNTYNSYWRYRNRTRVKYALNRESMLEEHLWRLDTDIEFFVPLSAEPDERYLSNIRVRIGPEYKHSIHWSFRAFYSFDHSGNGDSGGGNIESHMLMLRIKYVF
ncbi:DUF2490 domain-containing protein [Carboxylicivirga sp. N1Y90]|uniref:DUF2490 domain-containing protein n=1 Tax=Carboxylicivirga fragile TaxID=3417571 RepID=UPI003D332BE4|nr:DUF2490 domain-containing protein [Marinilabiliaceae bacterium N1Y90]